MNGSALFRKEALERESLGSDIGRISISRPRHVQISTLAAIILILSAVGLGTFGKYKPSVSVGGIIMPITGQFDIVAPADGVVSEISVKEGDYVGKLDVLVRLSDLRAREDGLRSTDVVQDGIADERNALIALGEASEKLHNQKERELRRDIESRLHNIDLMESEVAVRERQVHIEAQVLAQYEELLNNKYVSSLDVSRQRIAVDSQTAGLISLRRDLNSALADLEKLQSQLGQIALERDMSTQQTKKELASASVRSSTSLDASDYFLTAPDEGIVATRLAEPAQSIKAGQPLLTIIPKNARLSARLILPSSSIKSANIGDKVALRISSHPHQKFGLQYGIISSVSGASIPPSAMQDELKNTEGSYFYVWVELEKGEMGSDFIPGVTVDAEILGKPRPIYKLVTDPLSRAFY